LPLFHLSGINLALTIGKRRKYVPFSDSRREKQIRVTGVRFSFCAYCALVALSVSAVGAAHATSLMPQAMTAPAFGLLRPADFDGDGRTDPLTLVREASGRTGVHVHLSSADTDVRVTTVDGLPDIQVVKAGAYRGDCGSYATGCNSAVTAQNDSLIVGAGGASVLIHWQDGAFTQDFVQSDAAALAHAAAALYAVNP
jgi:hypothetical protein